MQAEAQAEAGMWALYLVKAQVRDDGENSSREPGDIGLHIYSSDGFHHNVRLYGMHFTEVDDDGSQKYEWYDDETVCYEGFLILNGSNLDGMGCIRLVAEEGDESTILGFIPIPNIGSLSADDIVFEATVCENQLSHDLITQIEGDCDIPGRCATLWLRLDRNWDGHDCEVVLPPKPCR